MSKINSIIYKICQLLANPIDIYWHKFKPRMRHHKYPHCHPSAIVNRPLKFNPEGVTLGKSVYIFKYGRISCVYEYAGSKYNPNLAIGDGTTIQQNVHITCAKYINIGKACAITHNVTITDIDHSFEYEVPNHIHPTHNPLIIRGGGRYR